MEKLGMKLLTLLINQCKIVSKCKGTVANSSKTKYMSISVYNSHLPVIDSILIHDCTNRVKYLDTISG